MDIVLINGLPRSGKDTFVSLCSKYAECANISTIDPIKEAAKLLGWNGEKTPEARKFLSDLKDMAESCFNTSEKYLDELIPPLEGIVDVVFIHCREPEQLHKLRAKYHAITLYIEAGDRLHWRPEDITNHADRDVSNFSYDLTIWNNKGISELDKAAEMFVKDLNKLKYRLVY